MMTDAETKFFNFRSGSYWPDPRKLTQSERDISKTVKDTVKTKPVLKSAAQFQAR